MSDAPGDVLDEPAPPRTLLRAFLAVVLGIATVVVLSTVADSILHGTGVYPPPGQPMSDGLFAVAAAYRILFAIAGGWVTAKLAPSRPMRYAMVLGAIGLVAGTAGVIATWGKGPEFGPTWYAPLVAATALPCVWLGARLATRGGAASA